MKLSIFDHAEFSYKDILQKFIDIVMSGSKTLEHIRKAHYFLSFINP